MIDLHTHSTASDGTCTPSELITLANEKGISTIALTDHDTVDGLFEASQKAQELGIRFIKGVEIEISYYPGEFHLLGLDLQIITPKLQKALDGLSDTRKNRNLKIIERLKEAGYPISIEDVYEVTKSKMIGRPHIADAMIKNRIVKNREQAFQKFLAKGKPFYEPKACIELDEAITLIKDAGGFAIVAHPLSLFISFGHLVTLFQHWKEMGIDGIEAWHPAAKRGHCERLERMARALNFRVTAGSDYHGSIRADRKIGITAGNKKIDDIYLEDLKR